MDGHEGEEEADSYKGGADDGCDPVDFVLCCPAVEEEADGDDEGCEEQIELVDDAENMHLHGEFTYTQESLVAGGTGASSVLKQTCV